MKRLFIAGLLLTLFSSCLTQKKREDITYRFLRENPLAASGFCAQAFPPKDTTVKTETHKADNQDYSGQIDALTGRIMELRAKMDQDSANQVQGGQITAQDVGFYKKQVVSLQKQLSDLKAAYKPCKPDTVTNTVYRENTAKVENLNLTLQALTKAQAVLQTQKDESEAARKKWMWSCLTMALAWGLFIVYKVVKG